MMNAAAVPHPAPHQLQAYCLGKLSEAEMLTLHAHVEKCSACAEALARVREDTFLRKIHAAQGPSVSPPPPPQILPPPTPTPTPADQATQVSSPSGPTEAWAFPPAPTPTPRPSPPPGAATPASAG